jgi:hypothetical protein
MLVETNVCTNDINQGLLFFMLLAVKVLFFAFFDICRLIKRPQDIPASKNLLTLCLMLYGVLSIQLAALSQPLDKAIMAGGLEVILIMLFSFVLLQINGKSVRWVQTVTALSGTGIIISIIALPLYLFIGIGSDSTVNSGGVQVFGLLFLATLACWNIAIMGHILRHALDINMFLAIVLSITYIWIIFSFTSAIMPTEVN